MSTILVWHISPGSNPLPQLIRKNHDSIVRMSISLVDLLTALLKQGSIDGVPVSVEICCVTNVLRQLSLIIDLIFVDVFNILWLHCAISKSQDSLAMLRIILETMHALQLDEAVGPILQFWTVLLVHWFLILSNWLQLVGKHS